MADLLSWWQRGPAMASTSPQHTGRLLRRARLGNLPEIVVGDSVWYLPALRKNLILSRRRVVASSPNPLLLLPTARHGMLTLRAIFLERSSRTKGVEALG